MDFFRQGGTERQSVFERMERCRSLDHPTAFWCRRYIANGTAHICFWCDICERPVTAERYSVKGHSVTVSWLLAECGVSADDLPMMRGDIRYRLCARCGATTPCEMHHVAPRAAFPDADNWPQIPLCRNCHAEFTERLQQYASRGIGSR